MPVWPLHDKVAFESATLPAKDVGLVGGVTIPMVNPCQLLPPSEKERLPAELPMIWIVTGNVAAFELVLIPETAVHHDPLVVRQSVNRVVHEDDDMTMVSFT